jgi:hypothetical protein
MTTTTPASFATSLTAFAASAAPRTTGAVEGTPRALLRLEGAALMALALAAYAHFALASWGLFAALFLAPDLAFVGYLAGPRVGAAAYNATHSTLGAVLLGAIAVALAQPTLGAVALVWAAHVGFDRMMGYGLKYGSAFGHTHLGRIGKDA